MAHTTSTASPWRAFFTRKRILAQRENTYRSLKVIDKMSPGRLHVNDRVYLNLSSNDYLGLACDPARVDDAQALAEIIPYGAGASRLLNGDLALHSELEKSLAEWKKTPAALVFSSGFQTNVGLIAALGTRGVTVYSDKLNHASIVDGCRLAEASFQRYRHGDADDLERLLKAHKRGRRIIVTDGVFSMDGDIAPLPRLNRLAQDYEALLIVDEAHATGVLGPEGAGSWSHCGIPWDEHVILMGTLSKAIGLQGGFVCASETVIDHLINHCRSFIYSTGLSPLIAGLAHCNIARIRTEPERLRLLGDAIHTLRSALREEGFAIPDDPTPIIPLILGDSGIVTQVVTRLWEEDLAVAGVRPPTVPEGTARLRLSVSATHSISELREAARLIAKIAREASSNQ